MDRLQIIEKVLRKYPIAFGNVSVHSWDYKLSEVVQDIYDSLFRKKDNG